MFRKTAVASALLLALVSPKIFALGLGELDMRSALNQPMDAVIELTSATSADMDDIEVSLASLQDHARAGLSKASILANFSFTLEKNAAGKPVVRIRSDEAVREPYLEFMLELDWSRGHLLRQYTVLVDPPVMMPAEAPPKPVAPVSRAVTPPPVTRAPVARPVPARPPVAAPSTVTVAPTPPAGASEYGPIRRNETLWSIAERLRPGNDVSVEQMMLALQRANPHAFEGNNINRLRAGVTLAVPDRDAVLAMSTREARAETRRQYAEWQSRGTQTSAASAPAAAESAAATEPAETEQPAVDASLAEAGPGESRLQLMAPDEDIAAEAEAGSAAPGNTAESAPGARQQLALAAEEVAAERAQSQELRSRVGELEDQVNTMKRLLELKDDELARLQQSVSGDTELPAEVSVDTEVSAETEDAAADMTPAVSATDTETETAAATETETTTAATLTDQAAGLVNRLMSNPLLAGLGVLVALLLGGILWATARARSSQGMLDDDLTMERQLAEEAGRDSFRSVPDVPISEAADEEPEIEEEAPVETMHEEADSDPLTEADVYLAYGRIQQAEDVLLSALQSHPDNADARLKLLEVYHSAGNAAAFDQAAATFHEMQGDQDERWERIAAMGLALSPHNALYGGAPAAAEGGEFDMDLSGLEEATPGAEASGTEAEDSNTIEFTLDTADEEDAGEGLLHSDDEMTTKLDLARAYIDMDDKDSARSILGEVLEEGNPEQKEEAESIIARMA